MESGLLAHSDEPCDAVSKPDGRRRGGWRAARFLIAVGFLERVGFNGVQGNLVMYLAGPMGMSTAAAATGANAWAGTVLVLTLVGALAADSRLGRYQAIVAAAVLHLLSLAMLTISSMTQATHPHPLSCHDAATACSPPPPPSPARLVFFHAALYLLALAQGFHNPCSEAFGADQFASSDHGARASRSSYFNWYHFFNSCGYAISNTALSYVEDNVSWTLGFTACFAMTAVYLPVFLLGTGTYRAEQPVDGGGATLARLVEASSSATRAWTARAFRRKDAICTERLLVKEEVEDGKGFFVKLLPIWVTSIVFTTVVSQQTTLFTKQGSTMDRRVGPRAGGGGGIVVPAAALQCVVSFTSMTLVPVYDRAIVPLARRFTGHPAGITTLQRVGAGMAISCHAMVVAALVEAKRLRAASDAGLIDRPDATVPMGVWWLVPQYLLVGLARVFGDIGLDEFFYDQAPDGLRSVGLAMSMSVRGVGNYVSGVLVSVIDTATRSGGESWFSDDLNRAHLDYFYWILAAFAALEVVVFVYIAKRYIYKNKGES